MDTLGLNQEALANETGLNKSTIWRYVEGHQKIPKLFSKYVLLRVASCNN